MASHVVVHPALASLDEGYHGSVYESEGLAAWPRWVSGQVRLEAAPLRVDPYRKCLKLPRTKRLLVADHPEGGLGPARVSAGVHGNDPRTSCRVSLLLSGRDGRRRRDVP